MKQEEHDVIRSGGKVLGHGGRKAWIAIGEEVFFRRCRWPIRGSIGKGVGGRRWSL